MTGNKHASSRNRPKMGHFDGKSEDSGIAAHDEAATSFGKLASFRLREGSNK